MTTKEWLNRGINLNTEINTLLEEQHKLFNIACKTTTAMTAYKAQVGNTSNMSEEKYIKYADYSRIIDKRIDELYKIKEEILVAINDVDDSTSRTILILRYLQFKTWEKIAVEINHDYYYVIKKLHPKALNKIKKPQKAT